MQKCDRIRRGLLLRGMSTGLALPFAEVLAQGSSAAGELKDAYIPRVKHALLIGNRAYPGTKEIPPAHKNVRDISEALEFLEFKVTAHTDLNAQAMRAAVAEFGESLKAVTEQTLPGSLAVVFYFCGHGFQSEGQNYLVPSGVDPSSETAVRSSLKLVDDVLSALPSRYPGISVALIDACRTDPNLKRGVDDFNQITAPEGTMVFFATRAGRPALAPVDPNRNTFFTEALYNSLIESNGVTPLDDLFQLTAVTCQRKVKTVFDAAKLSLLPQFPELTSNLRGKFVVRNQQLERTRQERRQQILLTTPQVAGKEDERWKALREAYLPRRIVQLCEEFLRDFPVSENAQAVQATMDGARQAADGQRQAGLTSDAINDVRTSKDEGVRDDLLKSVRGDKDAAYRLAQHYRGETRLFTASEQRLEAWLKFSAELGNGIASWQLAAHYSASGRIGEVARYERRAVELGYRPPPRLTNRGY